MLELAMAARGREQILKPVVESEDYTYSRHRTYCRFSLQRGSGLSYFRQNLRHLRSEAAEPNGNQHHPIEETH